ncbi:amidohydrolase family protein [Larkinella insperata]|uniref:Amidohydrolase family protein n=1 Tax=Larkinella insperata TaxID=332158 RepID=A0ABW3Q4N5_9BACT|nr:amidohydrolase family protein [Larkinella insperata]
MIFSLIRKSTLYFFVSGLMGWLFLGPRSAVAQGVENLRLTDYRPQSIYRIPKTTVTKAKFPVIDVHSHDFLTNSGGDLAQWVKTMDGHGIKKTIVLTMSTGARFDSLVAKYKAYPDRFDLWCGFDFTGYDKDPKWTDHAIKELERCQKMGAKGIGEVGDKGLGLFYDRPTKAYGMHIDDPRMKPLLKRCGELGMPINIHVAESYWMYQKVDSTNDGLINAAKWHVYLNQPDILNHGQMIKTLENAVRDNPGTTFIACHLANCDYDLTILGKMLDTYPNLYADISARYGETATIPRYMKKFYERYQDRLLYGTDMAITDHMYQTTFRILETADEHFYEIDEYHYHWPLHGFDLSDQVLKKLYSENAEKLLYRKKR